MLLVITRSLAVDVYQVGSDVYKSKVLGGGMS